MNFIITLIILILVLGIIVFIHELGHFIAAKKSGVHVYEFALGMGPKIFSFKRKGDPTIYSLRLLPLGGFNALASEVETSKGVRKEDILENKTHLQRFFVLIMGIVFNFILAIVLLFINGLAYGSPVTDPYIGKVLENSPAYEAGLKTDDLVLSINGKNVKSFDDVLLETKFTSHDTYEFLVLRDGKEVKIDIKPNITKDEEGKEVREFGFGTSVKKEKGFVNALKYGVVSTYKNSISVFKILGKLVTGKIGADNLSGPIGVFSVIDNIKASGLESIIYLTAYLSINVAIINFIPIPVFDGGRILLLLIEKIKGKKLNPKIETTLNNIGTILLLILMLYVTLNDILKIF